MKWIVKPQNSLKEASPDCVCAIVICMTECSSHCYLDPGCPSLA